MRPRSTRSPSAASSAGSTVNEPVTAVATTRTVPIARLAKVVSRVRNMPAIATITVRPETRTDRPEVCAAIASAQCRVPVGRDLTGRDLTGRDLTGRDLTGRDLTGRDLTGRDLTGRDLTGRDLAGRDLAG